ncbi:ABC transporter permease [Rugamonas sp.]|uniref:ABC transporter permease n=1 Tax=Rugamonas sp. TaxID=1926287 RepID=UPI0025D76080|nr:ABC transporter permease [Rugamonas sp.]
MSAAPLQMLLSLVPLLDAALRVCTPVLLAGLGALIAQRAGVVNLGLEGMMLAGALAGVVGSAWTGSAWAGLLAALACGAVLGLLLAGAVHLLRADLILSGVALNLAAAAGTTMVLFLLTGDKGISTSLASKVLPTLDLPLLDRIPVLSVLLSGRHVLTYAAFAAVPLVALLLRHSRYGLRLRAVGHDAQAAAIAGVAVARVQCTALALSGAFAGLAGAYLSMGYVSWFAANMTAGRGYMGIAAEVMGRGTALGTCASALLLGLAEAAAVQLQGAGLPSELIQTIPYIVPVVALCLYARRASRLSRAAGATPTTSME